MSVNRRISGVSRAAFLGPALAFVASAGGLRAADLVAEGSPVTFSLSRTAARPGEKATLVFSLKTEVALRSISVAMDFEESRVRVLEFRRAQSPFLGSDVLPPGDVASTSVNNADQVAGDQTREGWIHFEIDIQGESAELPLEKGLEVAVLEIEFLVLPDALAGFSPVAFETVGPVDSTPSTYLVNRFEMAGLAPVASDLSAADLKGGGIDIIGEVGFFMRGDANFDRLRDITDPIVSLSFLFLGGPALPCLEAGDANDDGLMDISDPIFTLSRLFERADSFPNPDRWGPDPTPDRLGCAVYPGM